MRVKIGDNVWIWAAKAMEFETWKVSWRDPDYAERYELVKKGKSPVYATVDEFYRPGGKQGLVAAIEKLAWVVESETIKIEVSEKRICQAIDAMVGLQVMTKSSKRKPK